MALLVAATDVAGSGWVSVALAMLNVVQTIALAYLAADRHAVRSARAAGYGSRAGDSPTTRQAP